MDTAKAINILIGGGLDDFAPLAEQVGLFDDAEPLPPHIAFPTTAGTGAEVTLCHGGFERCRQGENNLLVTPIARRTSPCWIRNSR